MHNEKHKTKEFGEKVKGKYKMLGDMWESWDSSRNEVMSIYVQNWRNFSSMKMKYEPRDYSFLYLMKKKRFSKDNKKKKELRMWQK